MSRLNKPSSSSRAEGDNSRSSGVMIVPTVFGSNTRALHVGRALPAERRNWRAVPALHSSRRTSVLWLVALEIAGQVVREMIDYRAQWERDGPPQPADRRQLHHFGQFL